MASGFKLDSLNLPKGRTNAKPTHSQHLTDLGSIAGLFNQFRKCFRGQGGPALGLTFCPLAPTEAGSWFGVLLGLTG